MNQPNPEVARVGVAEREEWLKDLDALFQKVQEARVQTPLREYVAMKLREAAMWAQDDLRMMQAMSEKRIVVPGSPGPNGSGT